MPLERWRFQNSTYCFNWFIKFGQISLTSFDFWEGAKYDDKIQFLADNLTEAIHCILTA